MFFHLLRAGQEPGYSGKRPHSPARQLTVDEAGELAIVLANALENAIQANRAVPQTQRELCCKVIGYPRLMFPNIQPLRGLRGFRRRRIADGQSRRAWPRCAVYRRVLPEKRRRCVSTRPKMAALFCKSSYSAPGASRPAKEGASQRLKWGDRGGIIVLRTIFLEQEAVMPKRDGEKASLELDAQYGRMDGPRVPGHRPAAGGRRPEGKAAPPTICCRPNGRWPRRWR